MRLGLVVALVALLVGCGSTEPAPKSPPPEGPGPNAARYTHLPDQGPVMDYMRRQDRAIAVDRGYYSGTWVARGPGYQKRGAGFGETVIDGDLEVRGDGWVIRKLTITGDVRLLGDDNDVSGCEVLGRVSVRGVGNKAP